MVYNSIENSLPTVFNLFFGLFTFISKVFDFMEEEKKIKSLS